MGVRVSFMNEASFVIKRLSQAEMSVKTSLTLAEALGMLLVEVSKFSADFELDCCGGNCWQLSLTITEDKSSALPI